MAAFLLWRILGACRAHLGEGVAQAVSSGLKDVYAAYTASFFFSSVFLLFGLVLLSMALIVLQSKFYFEELYRLGRPRADRAKE